MAMTTLASPQQYDCVWGGRGGCKTSIVIESNKQGSKQTAENIAAAEAKTHWTELQKPLPLAAHLTEIQKPLHQKPLHLAAHLAVIQAVTPSRMQCIHPLTPCIHPLKPCIHFLPQDVDKKSLQRAP